MGMRVSKTGHTFAILADDGSVVVDNLTLKEAIYYCKKYKSESWARNALAFLRGIGYHRG